MPLVRIALRRGKSPAYLAALRNGIYRAMREAFDVPENDRFILISQHEADEFDYDAGYLGIARDDGRGCHGRGQEWRRWRRCGL